MFFVGFRAIISSLIGRNRKTPVVTRKEARQRSPKNKTTSVQSWESNLNQSEKRQKSALAERLTISLNEVQEEMQNRNNERPKKKRTRRNEQKVKQKQPAKKSMDDAYLPSSLSTETSFDSLDDFDYDSRDFETELNEVEAYYNEMEEEEPDFFVVDDGIMPLETPSKPVKGRRRRRHYQMINPMTLRQGIIIGEIMDHPRAVKKSKI